MPTSVPVSRSRSVSSMSWRDGDGSPAMRSSAWLALCRPPERADQGAQNRRWSSALLSAYSQAVEGPEKPVGGDS